MNNQSLVFDARDRSRAPSRTSTDLTGAKFSTSNRAPAVFILRSFLWRSKAIIILQLRHNDIYNVILSVMSILKIVSSFISSFRYANINIVMS
jgi:hypothetical protein